MTDEDSEAVEYVQHHVPEIQVSLPVEEEDSNQSGKSESSVQSPVDVGEAEQIAIAQMHDLSNQESSSMQVEFSDQDDGVLVSRPGSEECDSEDAKVSEDAGKEDMFVDAPEELIAYDGRNIDRKLNTLIDNPENLEQANDIRESQFNDHHYVDEVQGLKAMLEKAVAEKEVALEERLQTEGTLRELHAILYGKDKEIEELHTKVAELSFSHDAINAMLYSFGNVVNYDELSDGTAAISDTDSRTSLLTENYNKFLSEVDQLKQSLTEAGLNQELGTIFINACDELLELRSKQAEFVGKLNHLENENYMLVEQLDKVKGMVGIMNVELGKMRTELEQEKAKSANTKEKLSMAVTKGKALVQQRDSLRQAVAEKTSELEKCLAELQEKSSALEAAELIKEELVKSENMSASLQAALSERDAIIEKFEFILSQTNIPEDLQSMDNTEKIRWLVDEKSALDNASIEFLKVKDVLSLIELPEMVSSLDLASKVNWLIESFHHEKNEVMKLQESLTTTMETARNEIGNLTVSLSAEIQEKNYLQTEMDDLSSKYESIVQKEHQLSLEMDQLVRMLLEASGSTLNDEEGDMSKLIERCLGKVKEERNALIEASRVESESFERILELLYLKSQELNLCEDILEEEVLDRSKANNLLDELRVAIEELPALKHEKNTLQKDLEKSEEKSAMLREKLSMAVKKGKGLVQDRENLKSQLDEKNKEIEKLNLKLQDQEAALGDYKGRNSKLEMDLLGLNEQKDQVEKLLEESNNMLQKVIESVDSIILPVNSVLKDPLEKVKWVAEFCNECQSAKTHLEKNLELVREEASNLNTKLEEANASIRLMEGELYVALNNISQLDEKNKEIENLNLKLQKQESALGDYKGQNSKLEMELLGLNEQKDQVEKMLEESNNMLQKVIESVDNIILPVDLELKDPLEKVKWVAEFCQECQSAKTHLDQKLGLVREEASNLNTKLEEANASISLMEGELSVAQSKISQFDDEKRELESGKINIAQELQKAVEEAHNLKSLENALLVAENKISALHKEKEDAYARRDAVEVELENVNKKVSIQMSELAEAYNTIKTLEEAISQVESKVALITEENNNAQACRTDLENELNNKLKDAMNSQAVSLQDSTITVKSLEDALLKAENNVSVLVREKEVVEGEILKLNSKLSVCLEELSGTHGSFETTSVELVGHLKDLQALMNDETLLYLIRKSFEKNYEKLKEIDVILKDMRGNFVEGSEPNEEDSFPRELFSHMVENLSNVEVNDGEVNAADVDNISSKFKKIVEEFQERSKSFRDKFENVSSFMDQYATSLMRKFQATRDDFIVHTEQIGSLKQELSNMEISKHAQEDTITTLEKQVAKLVAACDDVTKQFEDMKNSSVSSMEDLQNNLEETKSSLEITKEEKVLSQNRVLELETNLKQLNSLCSELRLQVEDLQAKTDKVMEREAEVSLAYNTLLKKNQEKEDPPMSESEIKALFEKISFIKVSFSEIGEDLEHLSSAEVKKLFHILDNFTELQHQLKLLVHDKEELESSLSTQALESQQLKEEKKKHLKISEELERIKSEVSELTFGLEKMIIKLGGNDSDVLGNQNLLLELEKLVMALIVDCEKSKSKANELSTKLIGSQKVEDDLSNKVKLLEESLQSRPVLSQEIVQERSIFEAPSVSTSSEISEIADVGSVAKSVRSPSVPLAAQMRTMRKGSADHLVLDIGTESDRLINSEETDEDKGHVFKSLNTSGIIPIQGKMVADRIDGIWVSGGRLLMSRPRARLGLIAYWFLIHIWLLGSLL